jgi:hypothetical protein
VTRPPKKVPAATDSKTAKNTAAPGDTVPAATATRVKQPARSPARLNYDRLEDPGLKLQALAWSDDKDRRMAVINGRIVHEGESVDGYQVITIRREDIILKEGQKSWRLEFGLQR